MPLLAELLGRPKWHSQAACRGMGPDRWFPEKGQRTDEARAICDGCQVRSECAEAGVREPVGIWAGETAQALRRARRGAA
jgi:WhiB family transcriptional regulator, redox-sensing transcriptional regulator